MHGRGGVRDREPEEVGQRRARAGREAERHVVGQVYDVNGNRQLFRQDGVSDYSGIPFDNSEIPASGRQGHGGGVGQDIDVLVRAGRVEAAEVGTYQRRQRQPVTDDEVGVTTHLEKLEGGLVGIGGNIEGEVARGVISVEHSEHRDTIAQGQDVEVHAQDDGRRSCARVPYSKIVSLAGQQGRRAIRN